MELTKHIQKLINKALAIEEESAEEAGRVSFMARALVQATLPYSKQPGNEFERKNGKFRLSMLAPAKVGLPYGSIPRLLIVWLTTEAVKTRQREIVLGHTLTEFMEQLNLIPTGGRWGTITRLREQMEKLFSSSVSCSYNDGNNWAIKNVQPISKANLWWNPKSPEQTTLFKSTVTLGEDFFNEVITNPVPVDMETLKSLKKSPLALDIYCWLTYRMSYLRKSNIISWMILKNQFGSNYAVEAQGMRNFKKSFIHELKKVHFFYPEAKIDISPDGLILIPSKTHII